MVEMRSVVWSPARKKANIEAAAIRGNVRGCSLRLAWLILTCHGAPEAGRHSESVKSNPCSKQGELLQVAQGWGQLVLNISKDGDSAASLGRVCWCSVTLTAQFFFPTLRLHVHYFSLLLVLSLHMLRKEKGVHKNDMRSETLSGLFCVVLKYWLDCEDREVLQDYSRPHAIYSTMTSFSRKLFGSGMWVSVE